MMFGIGFILALPIGLIIFRLSSIKIKFFEKFLLNLIMNLMCILYIYFCFKIPQEPFDFKITQPLDYLLYTACIYLFTPSLWIVTIYYVRGLTKRLRISKNSIIKENQYIYYRDTLNKVSPNIIMYTSLYDIDLKRSISATILKLKLTGFIEENNKTYKCTNKDATELSESERMVLDLVKNNKFDRFLYAKTIKEETIKNKYIKKNSYGKIGRIIKIIIILTLPVLFFTYSIKLDKYVFKNYHVITVKETGEKYYDLKIKEDIKKLQEEVTDETHFYGSYTIYPDGKEGISYSCDRINVTKLEYSIVRKALFLNISVPLSILFCIVWVIITIYLLIDQLININNNYKRTIKGKELLNKAYALKNFIKDFSNDKTEKELVLWDYYLIYATVLDVNEKIQDEIIDKYIK